MDCLPWTVLSGGKQRLKRYLLGQNKRIFKLNVKRNFNGFICTTGLEKLYQKTSKNRWELRVDLSLWNGSSAFATYSGFKVASESDGYRLHLDSFTGGDAGT